MDRKQIGRRVAQRRRDLRLDVADVVRAAGVDRKTHTSLERGERWPRDSTRAKIEAALQWETGALDRLADGYEPIPVGNLAGVSDMGEELFFIRDVDVAEPAYQPTVAPGARRDVAAGESSDELPELLRRISNGDIDDEAQERARYLLDDINIEQLPRLIDKLSRPNKVRLTEYVLDLLEAEMIEGLKTNAVEEAPESRAQGEAGEGEKTDDNVTALIRGDQGSRPDRRPEWGKAGPPPSVEEAAAASRRDKAADHDEDPYK